jgi:hypothetical protein
MLNMCCTPYAVVGVYNGVDDGLTHRLNRVFGELAISDTPDLEPLARVALDKRDRLVSRIRKVFINLALIQKPSRIRAEESRTADCRVGKHIAPRPAK